jgi:hypothetical protein
MSTNINIPEGQQDRKDFKDWQVVAAYMAQEGICGNPECGNPLDRGFHRHHLDGDHTNNKIENLRLDCPECHRATLKGPKKDALDEHRKHEKYVFTRVNEAIDQTLAGKLSGASAERLLDAISLSLKMSHSVNGIDNDIEHIPLPIRMTIKQAERDVIIGGYVEGFKDCMKSFRQIIGESKPGGS